ncbi:MAG: GNAT family N-acetyltransferase [Treponema sp.]|jgi:predicted N-acetyltransferase YhbS|nr:GNAT family N-acetyltransferase [Treponema sp.]
METQIVRAAPQDRDEVIDLGNYVFSHSHNSVDFPSILPKLYKAEYFMEGIHYLVKEDGRIKAAVGAYPLELEINGMAPVPGRGIGMVSVHPYCRSKGYMKALMKTALDDMKKDGIVFSCLGGQRQRYEYFGFAPAGSSYNFTCNKANITHTLGRDWKSGLLLEKVKAEDTALLDGIQALHGSKSLRMRRSRNKLFEILSSWKAEIYAVKEGSRIEGYFIFNGNDHISEIVLNNYSLLIETIGLFQRNTWHDSIRVTTGPHETEKIKALSRFAEYYNQSNSYQFAVLDYVKFADALIKHKAGLEKIKEGSVKEGSFVLQIEDKTQGRSSRLRLFANKEGAGAEETNEEPALTINSLEACAFLLSPVAAQTGPAIRENDFLNSLLPLPLNVEEADRI